MRPPDGAERQETGEPVRLAAGERERLDEVFAKLAPVPRWLYASLSSSRREREKYEHRSRHRTLTQGMLDLKRLYWNTRAFRSGKREGKCPYEHLGLGLPDYDFWGLLMGFDSQNR